MHEKILIVIATHSPYELAEIRRAFEFLRSYDLTLRAIDNAYRSRISLATAVQFLCDEKFSEAR